MTDWTLPRVFAHRGGGTIAPENTLAAIRAGCAAGYVAVEFDVMLAADGIPVLMHDQILGRTVVGHTAAVSTISSAALVQMDAGSWFGPAFAGEPVPLYADVVRFCVENSIFMNVEIKPAQGFEAITGTTVASVTNDLFESLPAGQRALFSSFNSDALAAFRREASHFDCGHLFDRVDKSALDTAAELGCMAIHCNHRFLGRGDVEEIKNAGFGLFCYTVNSTSRARDLFSWGVDAFCTDRIDLIDPRMR